MSDIFNIETEEIPGGLKLFISKEHRFGTDALKLAEFAAVRMKKNHIVCDLCTGCGIVPFLLISKDVKPVLIFALDIKAEAVSMLHDSVKINSLNQIIFPFLEDVKNINWEMLKENDYPVGKCDLVTVNPPYYKAKDGLKRETGAQARHELLCELEDVIKTGAKFLKYGGRFIMCHLPERLSDVICALRKYNLEPKNIEFLINKNNKRPWLMLVDAKKGGKPSVRITVDYK